MFEMYILLFGKCSIPKDGKFTILEKSVNYIILYRVPTAFVVIHNMTKKVCILRRRILLNTKPFDHRLMSCTTT